MKQWLAVMALLFTAAGVANAQVPTSGNIFFGYSYNRADTGSGGTINLNGWEGSLEGKVLPFLGIVADFSGHYGSQAIPIAFCTGVIGGNCLQGNVSSREHSFLFGPRASVSLGPFRPFVHVLIGASHVSSSASSYSSSDTSFGDAIGGGVDYKVLHLLAVRIQADALQTRFYSQTQNDFRFSTGLVFNF